MGGVDEPELNGSNLSGTRRRGNGGGSSHV